MFLSFSRVTKPTLWILITDPVNSIQWGSEICTSLYFEWSKRGWGENGPDFEWNLKSWSPTIWNPDKNGQILNGPVFKWYELKQSLKPDHLKTGPFEIWPSKSLDFKMFSDFKWSDFKSPLYLCIFITVFGQWCKIPTVVSGILIVKATWLDRFHRPNIRSLDSLLLLENKMWMNEWNVCSLKQRFTFINEKCHVDAQ